MEGMGVKILLTGGTGFIGRYLVPMLLADHVEVALLVRETYGLGTKLPAPLANLRTDIQLVYADLRNFRLTKRAVTEAAPDIVVHLAAAGATSPFLAVETALRHNVHGTINLLRACFEKKSTIKRMIVARTPGERTSMNPYAASKAAAWNFCEMYARTQGWPIIGAMIFQCYGWGQPAHALVPSAFSAALANIDFPMTEGCQQRDWIHADDVAKGIMQACSAEISPGTTVELGTGKASSVREMVETIYTVCQSQGTPLIGALAGRPGEELVQAAALEKNQIFGWQAYLTLETGLTRYHEQCIQQRYRPIKA